MVKDLRVRKGMWNEYKISNWRKRQYGRQIIILVNKVLSDDFVIQYDQLQGEDSLLYKHIIAANDLDDLKKYVDPLKTLINLISTDGLASLLREGCN